MWLIKKRKAFFLLAIGISIIAFFSWGSLHANEHATDLLVEDDIPPEVKSMYAKQTIGEWGVSGLWLGNTHFNKEARLTSDQQNGGAFFLWRVSDSIFQLGSALWSVPIHLKERSSHKTIINETQRLTVDSTYTYSGRQTVIELNGAVSAHSSFLNILVGAGWSYNQFQGQSQLEGGAQYHDTETNTVLLESNCNSKKQNVQHSIPGRQFFINWEYPIGNRIRPDWHWGIFFAWKYQWLPKQRFDEIRAQNCTITDMVPGQESSVLESLQLQVTNEMDFSNQTTSLGVAYHF